MHFYNVNIPDKLVSAAHSGTLVIFAGAGVSRQRPVEYPLFDKLVADIKEKVDPAKRCRERRYIPKQDQITYTETPEQYLSYLDEKTHSVRSACCSLLSSKDQTNNIHKNLLRLFPDTGSIKIVTTNFDDCFEIALNEAELSCNIFSSPALPFGDDFNGLVHLHGTTEDPAKMVLLAEDYGKAYVTNGWATRFLVDLFKGYTVLFIGYKCGDSLVDYLTRSISNHISGNSYAFCKVGQDNSDWVARGVTPIHYNEHKDLVKIVEEWTNYLKQSITDRAIKLRDMAMHEDLTNEDTEYLLSSLTWNNHDDRTVFAREFCSQSTSFKHFTILNEHFCSSFLTKDTIDDSEQVLLQWAISNFFINDYSKAQLICLPIRNKLSLRFFDCLTYQLLAADASPQAIGAWIAWLESMPPQYHHHCSYALLDIAGACNEPEVVLAIIRMLLRVNLTASENYISGMEQEATIAITDTYYKETLLKELRKHKASIGKRVFSYCIQQIELAYSIQTGCWTNPNTFDGISFSRSSVEPHEQDRHSDGAGSILLDAARESVDAESAIEVIGPCLKSKCAIIVRLGLWLMKEYNCSGESLHVIQEHDYLSNPFLHHEVFHLVRSSFAIASDNQKAKFANYLESYFASKDDSDYACFNLCHWILEKTASDKISRLKNATLLRNPNFLPREHPDLTHYMSSGFVENSSKCKIELAEFTIDNMLKRLSNPAAIGSFVTEFDIVSAPCKDYPAAAFNLIRELTNKNRGNDESDLCNLLIKAAEWNSPYIPTEEAAELFTKLLSQQDLCVEGIKALALFSLMGSKSIKWSSADLSKMLESASKNISAYIHADSAFQPHDGCDWLLVGINHPAGKYLQLIAVLDQTHHRESGHHCDLARKMLREFDPISLDESIGAKALIACFFERLNTWSDLDRDYALMATSLLTSNDWSSLPAWQGIAKLSTITAETWDLTKNQWESLFANKIQIEKECLDSLVHLYTWIAIVHANKTDRIKMIESCATASTSALETTCLQINGWLKTLDEESRISAWHEWLSEAFRFIAVSKPQNAKILANTYCRWAKDYTDLRPIVAKALQRDCSNVEEKELLIRKGVLTDISLDSRLSSPERATIITFLLNHQKYFSQEKDAREAASNIDINLLSNLEKEAIRDAYTRKGMIDVVFR